VLGALAAALLAAPLAAPDHGRAAVAGIQDDVMTTAPPDELPARVEMVRRTRARVARVDVLWSMVAPTRPPRAADARDPAYDWTRIDAIVRGLAKARITPIVSVYGTPRWAVARRTRPHDTAYNPNAPRPAWFGQFMGALANRYSGRFRPAAGEARLPRVRHFEIWNEPNLKSFLSVNGRANLTWYKAMVRAAWPRIRHANRRAEVIAGAGGPRSSAGGGNVAARTWMNGLLRDRRVRFTAFSQHIYPSRGPRFRSRSYDRAFPTWQSVPDIIEALDRHRPRMKLYVTEAGYTTARTPFRTVRVSPRAQRLYLKQIFALPAVRSPRVAAVIWFNLQDNRNWPGGLLRAGGARKPSYAAFRGIAARPIPRALRTTLRR
jgi:hypothetical protein